MKERIIKSKMKHKRWYYDVEEELYKHEASFYSACAGSGSFEATKEWEDERERLTKILYVLSPYVCPYEVKKKPKTTQDPFGLLRNALFELGNECLKEITRILKWLKAKIK